MENHSHIFVRVLQTKEDGQWFDDELHASDDDYLHIVSFQPEASTWIKLLFTSLEHIDLLIIGY